MAKHDIAKQEKALRNAAYAHKYRQKKCKQCNHKSSQKGVCVLCGGQMK